MALRIDVYDGPRGTGYTVTLLVEIAGERWGRTAHTGPETYRQLGWMAMPTTGLL